MNVTSLYQVKCRNMLVLREMVGNLINIIALYYMAFVREEEEEKDHIFSPISLTNDIKFNKR